MSLDVHLRTPRCQSCGSSHEVFWQNITHNLGDMAKQAGIYYAVWRPEEVGIETAKDLIPTLRAGIELMRANPKRFKQYDSPNGWGLYDNFLPWLERYLQACEQNPNAEVEVSR